MLDIPRTSSTRLQQRGQLDLWFVHHLLFDTTNQPQFGLRSHLTGGLPGYNEAFADALAKKPAGRDAARSHAGPGLHLSLVPRMLRERLDGVARDTRIAHFCHIPWAPPDYYRILPSMWRALLDASSARTTPVSRRAVAPPSSTAARRSWRGRGPHGGASTGGQARRIVGRSATGPRHRGAVHPLAWTPTRCGPARGRRCARSHRHARRSQGKEADRQGGPDGAVQEHRARPGRLPRAARTRRSGGTRPAPGLRYRQVAVPSTAYTSGCDGWRGDHEEFGTADWNPLILEVKDDYPRSLAACALPTCWW